MSTKRRRGHDGPAGCRQCRGAIPSLVTASLERAGAPVLFFGTGLPEDRWHDSGESVRVDVLLAGAATMCLFGPAPAALGNR